MTDFRYDINENGIQIFDGDEIKGSISVDAYNNSNNMHILFTKGSQFFVRPDDARPPVISVIPTHRVVGGFNEYQVNIGDILSTYLIEANDIKMLGIDSLRSKLIEMEERISELEKKG